MLCTIHCTKRICLSRTVRKQISNKYLTSDSQQTIARYQRLKLVTVTCYENSFLLHRLLALHYAIIFDNMNTVRGRRHRVSVSGMTPKSSQPRVKERLITALQIVIGPLTSNSYLLATFTGPCGMLQAACFPSRGTVKYPPAVDCAVKNPLSERNLCHASMTWWGRVPRSLLVAPPLNTARLFHTASVLGVGLDLSRPTYIHIPIP